MKLRKPETIELSVIMPCLNERGTVGLCVGEALSFIKDRGLSGEVIVVDNKSTDGSGKAASEAGAVVTEEVRRGYGSAIQKGIKESRGRVIIIGDCDSTYDFKELDCIYDPLSRGDYDVMIGNRLAGKQEKGAMPFMNRLGGSFLSAVGRKRYHVAVRDFHCGLRGLTRNAAERLDFCTDGMEFATEMIALAAKNGLSVGEAPVSYRPSLFERNSKLRPFSDGLRHLRYMLRK